MKRLLLLAAISFGLPAAHAQTYYAGFNFRNTQNFVTGDHATACYNTTSTTDTCVENQQYPTSTVVNGHTFNSGYDQSTAQRVDRNAALDIRLAGITYWFNNATPINFTVILGSTGAKCIHLAVGDDEDPHDNKVEIFDDSTPLFDVTGPNSDASFLDATGAEYSSANWPASETGMDATFATTTLVMKIGRDNGDGGTVTTLAHLGIEDGTCGGVPPSDAAPRHRVIQ